MTGPQRSAVADRLEIMDVLARYALGMDLADEELFGSVWSDDARWTCEALGLDAKGRESIMDWYRGRPGRAPASPAPGSATRLAGNQHVLVDGDRATAMSETASFRYTGRIAHPYAIGYYRDELVRTESGWRLSRRDMVVTPVVPLPEEDA